MRVLGLLFILIAVGMCLFQISEGIKSAYVWDRDYNSYWELADKSATINDKADRLEEFVGAIQKNREKFAVNSAVFFVTPGNSFAGNFKALNTLNDRLKEIRSMDVKSFQYNTGLQQITDQEMRQANPMITVLNDCFVKGNYPVVWSWWGACFFVSYLLLAVIGNKMTEYDYVPTGR